MMKINRLNSSDTDFDQQLQSLLSSCDEPDAELTQTVQSILANVRDRGDAALLEYTNKFDQRNAEIADLSVSLSTLEKARLQIPDDLNRELEKAAVRIKDYHER
ncbi:MAG: histidinol dehydrogenase, partial [Gammaproteobacteria bacterium]